MVRHRQYFVEKSKNVKLFLILEQKVRVICVCSLYSQDLERKFLRFFSGGNIMEDSREGRKNLIKIVVEAALMRQDDWGMDCFLKNLYYARNQPKQE